MFDSSIAITQRRVFAAPVPLPAPPPLGHVTLLTCQWLEGHPRELNWCGADVVWPGCSWCAKHEKVVYPGGRRPPA
jgi:hypothetical protein